MPIKHIVLFEFKPIVELTQVEDVSIHALIFYRTRSRRRQIYTYNVSYPYIQYTYTRATDSLTIAFFHCLQVCTRMLALPQQCRHPDTQELYVTGLGGGRNNSPEGLQVVIFPPSSQSSPCRITLRTPSPNRKHNVAATTTGTASFDSIAHKTPAFLAFPRTLKLTHARSRDRALSRTHLSASLPTRPTGSTTLSGTRYT